MSLERSPLTARDSGKKEGKGVSRKKREFSSQKPAGISAGLFRLFFAVSPVTSVHSEVRLGLGLRPGLRPDFAITTNAAEQDRTD